MRRYLLARLQSSPPSHFLERALRHCVPWLAKTTNKKGKYQLVPTDFTIYRLYERRVEVVTTCA